MVKLYEGGKQYNSKSVGWKSITTIMSEIEPIEIEKVNPSRDYRLLAVIKKIHSIKM